MIPPIKELRAICQEPVRQAEQGVFTNALYRGASIYVTKLFLQINITANQCTLLFTLLGVVGGVTLAIGTYWTNVIAALLFQISYLLDFVDGEIARYRRTSSRKGLFLDLIGHHFIDGALFAGLSFSAYASTHQSYMFALAFTAFVGIMSLYDLPLIRAYIAKRSGGTLDPMQPSSEHAAAQGLPLAANRPERRARRVMSVISRLLWLWSSPGIFGFTLIGALLNRLDLVVCFLGISSPIVFIRQAYYEARALEAKG